MFVFDLFEKKEKRASDQPASRFVSGFSQNADAKNALNTAMQVAPDASTPEEALAALANQQMQLNQQQSTALDQQTAVNQQQTQQINDLVTNIQRKEKDFRDLNAQIANMPNVTAQQAAKMAQDIEAAHDKDNKEPVSVPDVVAKQTQQPQQQAPAAVAAPGPGANVLQIAQYQKAKDQGAATAKPQPTPARAATPEPTTSKALGQMATQLTPGRVIKGKGAPEPVGTTNWAANQPTAQPKPTTGASNIKVFPNKVNPKQATGIQDLLASESVNEAQLKWSIPQNTNPKEIAKANLNNIVLGAIAPDHPPVKMYFTDGHGPTLPWNQVAALYNYLGALDKNNPGTQADVQNLLSNSRYFYDRMLNDIVGQTATDPVPQGQTVPDEEDPQAKLLEGDVIPMTGSPTVPANVKAYQYALEILKAAFDERVPTAKIDQMKQVLFHDFQARIQQAPDGTYYLNANGVKSRLPDPRTFSLEEEPYDGKSDWSDGQGQWSSENNLISSGNNPHGFSEAKTHDATGKPMYQATEKFLVRHNGKDVAFFPDMEQAKAAARDMQRELKGFATVHKVMREQSVAEAQTDYQKRRQRERDIDAGKPVAKQRQSKMTDYQKRRAQNKKDMELGESEMKDLFYKAQEDLKNLTDAQFIKTHGMSKVAFQQQHRTVLKPAAQQDVPVKESKNYWHQLQEERRRKAYSYLEELENALKDIK